MIDVTSQPRPPSSTAPDGTPVLAAKALDVTLGGRAVLQGIDCAVKPGELVGLIGPNGAGKTTLLRTLAGLVPANAGRVTLAGQPLAEIPRRRFAARVAYQPQGERPHWPLPVRDLVMLGRAPRRRAFGRPAAGDQAAVSQALHATGTEHLAERPATELSNGECARVLLARALAGAPEWLLADEPVGGLDPYHRLEVMARLQATARAGAGVVAVLHDLTLAARFCDRLLLLHGGCIAVQGTPTEVLTDRWLRRVYRVRALTGVQDGEPFVLPWARAAPLDEPQSPPNEAEAESASKR
ncbi:ABC transporter ATP-binding protein [Rhodovibrio salinarum]|uniref:ABC transporter ATP-binding protein n=1 Tax=Rhodovibrio salinarum TaxID=1087 RepID=A0A934QK07_9PROT|nr:ABC transporter ATP-binding protein [Rhodovibrio salinarum]MBK1697875.1 ABC transporter ATP-binding protein [Rhodovibrio salinarum]